MQLENVFEKFINIFLFFLSQIIVQKSCLKIDLWLIDLYLIKQKPW